ncbi:hypothetical protein BH11MYX3_BH11MYX3_35650 [soil metagenome]
MLLVAGGCGFHTPASNSGTGDARSVDAIGGEPGAPPIDAAMIDVAPDASSCPTSFVTVPAAANSSRYQVFAKASQLTALTTCSNLGAHLLRLDTQAEATALQAFIDAQITTAGDTGLYRIVGARDLLIRSLWHDLDLSLLTFLPWGDGEPTNGNGEDCIMLKLESGAGVIGADQCGTAHEFACECD